MNEGEFSTADAARIVGLTKRQLQHWRRQGWLLPSQASASGHARYTDADLQRLRVVRILLDGSLSPQRIRRMFRRGVFEALLAELSSEPGITETGTTFRVPCGTE